MPIGMFGKVSGPPGLARRRAVGVSRSFWSDVYVDGGNGAYATRKFGSKSLRFNTDGYVELKLYSDEALTTTTGIRSGSTGEGTVEFWIKSTGYSSNRVWPFYAYNSWAWMWDGGHYGAKGSGTNYFASSIEYTSPGAAATINDGNWHHIALVWNTSGHAELFRDGSYQGKWDNFTSNPTTFRFGNMPYSGSYNGSADILIDEIRISSVRRYTDIGGTAADYTVPTGPFVNDADTMGIYHCESTTGTDDTES